MTEDEKAFEEHWFNNITILSMWCLSPSVSRAKAYKEGFLAGRKSLHEQNENLIKPQSSGG